LLSGIHAVDILDKHRILLLARNVPSATFGSPAGDYLSMFMGGISNVPMFKGVEVRLSGPQDGDLLKAKVSGSGMPDIDGEAPLQPNFLLSFGDTSPWQNEPIIPTLSKAHAEARRVIARLMRAYFDPNNTF
jgi:hypothetical protein